MWYLLFILYVPNMEPTRIIVGSYKSANECLSENVIVDVPENYHWELSCQEGDGRI